jgi:hypothetical protein
MQSVWLTTEQASDRLNKKHNIQVGPRRLAQLRYEGGGPRFHRLGAKEVRYNIDEIDAWAKQRLGTPISSTSEETEHRRKADAEAEV